MITIYDQLVSWIGRYVSVPLLLTRLTIGVIFIQSGFGKLTHLSDATQFFMEIGIPFPYLNALFTSSTELLAGTFVLLGFLTRIAAIPLTIIMLVAIITAQFTHIGSISEFFVLREWDYIVMLSVVIFSGPGKASIDYLLRRTPR